MLGRSPSVADLLLLAQHTALEMLDLFGCQIAEVSSIILLIFAL